MPTGEERDIIEDYDEEAERLWKEKHRLSLKQSKQKEREEREKQNKKNPQKSKEKTDDDILKMLDEAELMEELEQELDTLDVEEINDETVRKLMSGEMKLPPEKKRVSYEKNISNENNDKEVLTSNIVKKNEMKDNLHHTTNNNVQPNPEITNLINSEINETEEETLPEEVALIKEQAKFLAPEDQIGFYDYQIEIIRQKLQVLPLRSQEQLDEKIRLLNVLENLEELLETAEETVGEAELTEKDSEIENDIESETLKNPEERIVKKSLKNVENKTQQKRRISFASEDQTLEFHKNQTVNQMLPPKLEKPLRDIIRLNDNEDHGNQKQTDTCSMPQLEKKYSIQAKVEKSLQFVSENQSEKDFDLVEQILQNSMGECNTLYIKFQHSNQERIVNASDELIDTPSSPADFYDLYVKSQEALKVKTPSTLFINSYEGEDQVKAPVLKETERKAAFTDPRAEVNILLFKILFFLFNEILFF